MNRAQWITIGIAVLLVFILYAASQKQFFGDPPPFAHDEQHSRESDILPDTLLARVKSGLTAAQTGRLNQLEGTAASTNTSDRLHALHQLAIFWRDTARELVPYAWYTAEAARLENSENSLTFAARLFLTAMKEERDASLIKWHGLQARDLLERSLKINPSNDSARVFLGETFVYGGFAPPMAVVRMITEVADENPQNIHAQTTLAEAALVSGQMDRAVERLKTVVSLKPDDLNSLLLLADIYEQKHEPAEAMAWYERALPHSGRIRGLKPELEKKIRELKNQISN